MNRNAVNKHDPKQKLKILTNFNGCTMRQRHDLRKRITWMYKYFVRTRKRTNNEEQC